MNRYTDMRQNVERRIDIVEFAIERRCIGIGTFRERRADKPGLEARLDIVELAIERCCIGIRKNVERRIDKVEIEASKDNRGHGRYRTSRGCFGGVDDASLVE